MSTLQDAEAMSTRLDFGNGSVIKVAQLTEQNESVMATIGCDYRESSIDHARLRTGACSIQRRSELG